MSRFEQLGEHWRGRSHPSSDLDPASAIDAVRRRAERLERQIRFRDRLEIGAAALALPFFVWVAIETRFAVSRVGAVIIVGACVLIPIRLRMARRPAPLLSASLLDALGMERNRVAAQRRLLEGVLWWYFLPLGTGVVLLVGGGESPAWFRLSFGAVVVVFMGWLNRANRSVVATRLRPEEAQLEAWIKSLADPAPSSPTTRGFDN